MIIFQMVKENLSGLIMIIIILIFILIFIFLIIIILIIIIILFIVIKEILFKDKLMDLVF